MKLYTFFQSGSAYRARIALSLKGIDYEPIFMVGGRRSRDLTEPDYLALNPSAVVPTLIDGETVVTQTMAIMEYLEEKYPTPALLPADLSGRSRVRAMAQVVVSDIHPLTTARVIACLDETLKSPQEVQGWWLRQWNERGFGVIEKMLRDSSRPSVYCHGQAPTMADIALVSQVFVATKFGIDIAAFPNLARVYHYCMQHPAFRDTAPAGQPDAQPLDP